MINLSELKLKYGRIFKATSIKSKVDIYFRLLTKVEYDRYISITANNTSINIEAEEYIFKCAVVYPLIANIEATLLFGEYHAIAEAICFNSGFHVIDKFAIELKRCRINSVTLIDQMLITIAKAFPIYKISDLENMNYQEIARLLSLAENLLEYYLQIPGAEVPGMTEDSPSEIAPKPIIGERPDTVNPGVIQQQREHALEALQASRNKSLF